MATKTFRLDPDVKVGTASVWEGTYRRTIFAKPFEHLPTVFLTVNDDVPRKCHLQAEKLALNEFYIRVVNTAGGQPVLRKIAWLAMDYHDEVTP